MDGQKAAAQPPMNNTSSVVGVVDVMNTLLLMFEPLTLSHGEVMNVPVIIDLILNWLLNVYDR